MNKGYMADVPQITSSCYASTTSNLSNAWDYQLDTLKQDNRLQQGLTQIHYGQPTPIQDTIMPKDSTTRRIVQVFIADPNDNVPLDKAVLYTGEQKLTDLNDTELFFEVPMQSLLQVHNALRVGFLDREASKRAGKDIFLDPVKIRDLKMVVVTIAQF